MTQAKALQWAALSAGLEIDELRVIPTASQIFMFSAVTWNRHQIHYNKDWAIAEGLPDIVVQRGLIGNFLGRMLCRWMGDSGEIETLSWKMTRSAFPDQELIFRGEVTQKVENDDGRFVHCAVRAMRNDEPIATGEAKLRFFSAKPVQ